MMMSNRDQILQLLDKVPEHKLGYVLAYIQGITIDEEADDLYCEKLYEEYLNDTDVDKDVEFSLAECKAEWGID